MTLRQGWLQRQFAHAEIHLEEMEKANKRIRRRCETYDKEHPLGPEYPPEPEWSIY